MIETITSDDICNEIESMSAPTMALLRTWYDMVQIKGDSERMIKRESELVIRGAIEGVTNIPPEDIIIDLDRNDT